MYLQLVLNIRSIPIKKLFYSNVTETKCHSITGQRHDRMSGPTRRFRQDRDLPRAAFVQVTFET
jgi:hypothetical protein